MAEILGAASSGTKLFLEVNAISIDNWTFKLFYKATTTILLACSVVASSKQFFGDPINCEVVRQLRYNTARIGKPTSWLRRTIVIKTAGPDRGLFVPGCVHLRFFVG
jgi:hypothetical protein